MEEKGNENIKTELTEIKKLLQDIAKRIDCIEEEIRKEQNEQSSEEIHPQLSDCSERKALRITTKGDEVAKQLGIYTMVDRNYSQIKEMLCAEDFTHVYDAWQFIRKQVTVYPEKFITDCGVTILKNEAYRKDIPLMEYTNIVAVIVRDKYVEEFFPEFVL